MSKNSYYASYYLIRGAIMGNIFKRYKVVPSGVTKQTCNICLTESWPKNCLQIQCEHIFCKDCFEEFLNQKITTNEISSIRCPISDNCHEILYNIIIQNISKELLEKYEKKLLENCLETENYIIRCPKVNCNEVVILNDESPLLGCCKKCNFEFCTNCGEEYHGLESCLFESQSQKKEVVRKYKSAWIIKKRKLEKRYTKKKLQELVGEYINEKCIEENCKPCPSCKVNIEKNGGCNKMVCTKCNHYFCWECNSILKKADPYEHFNRTNCVLFDYDVD
ncbi:hypothetical protein B4U80_14103 [Leptotrombidium deliense]|uniref:RBR-type E3 ubiquitin transferase n=1 Tax=Leptotrombidium deliense TaxID=299467 RepID=A0A443S2M5_9ACAR|nr:hypothetical protein B4U80_14103 [Leptotrombidium deliense]